MSSSKKDYIKIRSIKYKDLKVAWSYKDVRKMKKSELIDLTNRLSDRAVKRYDRFMNSEYKTKIDKNLRPMPKSYLNYTRNILENANENMSIPEIRAKLHQIATFLSNKTSTQSGAEKEYRKFKEYIAQGVYSDVNGTRKLSNADIAAMYNDDVWWEIYNKASELFNKKTMNYEANKFREYVTEEYISNKGISIEKAALNVYEKMSEHYRESQRREQEKLPRNLPTNRFRGGGNR